MSILTLCDKLYSYFEFLDPSELLEARAVCKVFQKNVEKVALDRLKGLFPLINHTSSAVRLYVYQKYEKIYRFFPKNFLALAPLHFIHQTVILNKLSTAAIQEFCGILGVGQEGTRRIIIFRLCFKPAFRNRNVLPKLITNLYRDDVVAAGFPTLFTLSQANESAAFRIFHNSFFKTKEPRIKGTFEESKGVFKEIFEGEHKSIQPFKGA